MSKAALHYERITISLPEAISKDIEELKNELHISKSELFKTAFEKFSQDYRKQKLQKAAEMMVREYATDKELTALTALDSEDFK